MTTSPNNPTTAKIQSMTTIGLMTAILCILAPFSMLLPFSPIPISLGTLVIYLACMVLGLKKGTICTILYLILGFAGLPVFSGFSGGVGKLIGPTGGYLIGYIFMALFCGFFAEKWNRKFFPSIIGMLAGTAVCYCLGTFWLSYQSSFSLSAAFSAAVLPFLPADIVKMLIAWSLGYKVHERLRKANFSA